MRSDNLRGYVIVIITERVIERERERLKYNIRYDAEIVQSRSFSSNLSINFLFLFLQSYRPHNLRN